MFFTEIDFATPLYDESFALRHEVLRKPLGIEVKEGDLLEEYLDSHLGLLSENGLLLAILVMSPLENGSYRMRQVAVRPELRNKGLGSELVRLTERWCRQNGIERIMLHARDTAVMFYLRLGYTKSGDEFTEVGIPHYIMEKSLH